MALQFSGKQTKNEILGGGIKKKGCGFDDQRVLCGLAVDSECPRDVSKDVSQGDRYFKLILQTSSRLSFFSLGECSGVILSVFNVVRKPNAGNADFQWRSAAKTIAAACFRHFPPEGATLAKKKKMKK